MRIEHPFRSAFDLVVRKAPIEAQLIVTRRCNLSCGYCSEYDDHSAEVPYDVLAARIDAIHRLRAANIALLGGEPLLHSRIEDVVSHAATRAQVSITTNGFLLDRRRIEGLGDAGLANMQISIDALERDPSDYVQKTLRSLRPKLDRLALHARFEVHVTTVLCDETLPGFEELLRELERYPFRISVNIVHDEGGQARAMGPEFVRAWKRHFEQGRPFTFMEEDYGRRLLSGEKPKWTCQAGARFLYVGEDGTVELCSAQRGRVGKSILEFDGSDLRAHRGQKKGCEEGCSVLCVYRDSLLDNDPASLGRAMLRGLLDGAFGGTSRRGKQYAPERPGDAPRRHLPIAAGAESFSIPKGR
jgi:MoaA/NifB/PqqE/SkfB family radical SAM enzyme